MEQEICKRTVSQANKSYKVQIILSLCWVALAFMVNCIIGGGVSAMFDGGLYWIGFGNMILGLVLALIFWLLSMPTTRTLVLTDKRVYYSITKHSFFSKKESFLASYPLSKVTNYTFHTLKKKERLLISTLTLVTPSSHIDLTVDEDFYNKFVNAVNNAQ